MDWHVPEKHDEANGADATGAWDCCQLLTGLKISLSTALYDAHEEALDGLSQRRTDSKACA